MKRNPYPHVFQPFTICGLTLKNRLEYSPTVVLKCNADGTMSQDMLDFMEWQARTGAGWVTVGDTPVTHDNTSHWLCEMNVCDDDCIHVVGRERICRLLEGICHPLRGEHLPHEDEREDPSKRTTRALAEPAELLTHDQHLSFGPREDGKSIQLSHGRI